MWDLLLLKSKRLQLGTGLVQSDERATGWGRVRPVAACLPLSLPCIRPIKPVKKNIKKRLQLDRLRDLKPPPRGLQRLGVINVNKG